MARWLVILLVACGSVPMSNTLKGITGASYRWHPEQFPIPVYSADETIVETRLATQRWNEAVDEQVFVPVLVGDMSTHLSFPPIGTISVVRELLMQWRGYSNITEDTRYGAMEGQIAMCEITVSPRSPDETRTITHELGHCLGLAHDLDKMSIMHSPTRPGATITEDDIAHVQWMLP